VCECECGMWCIIQYFYLFCFRFLDFFVSGIWNEISHDQVHSRQGIVYVCVCVYKYVYV
jgi:hypothetical protein